MPTLTDIEKILDRPSYPHITELFGDLEIPVLDGIQAQGDLLIVPVSRTAGAGATEVTKPVDVIEAANGGHAHTLLAPDGGARIAFRSRSGAEDLVIALLETTEVTHLAHMEHGATSLAPGCYELRGQKEFDAAEARRVAD